MYSDGSQTGQIGGLQFLVASTPTSGIVGFAIWVTVLVMVWWKLINAYRQLPADGLLGKRLAFVALAAFGSPQMSGFFVDLRMFDIPSILCFGLVGAAVGAAERYTRAGQEVSTET